MRGLRKSCNAKLPFFCCANLRTVRTPVTARRKEGKSKKGTETPQVNQHGRRRLVLRSQGEDTPHSARRYDVRRYLLELLMDAVAYLIGVGTSADSKQETERLVWSRSWCRWWSVTLPQTFRWIPRSTLASK